MMTWRRLVWMTTLVAVVTLNGCSKKSSGSPTEPSAPVPPAATIPSTPEKPAIASIDIPARTATLTFRAVAGATKYVIEIGTSPGGSDAATLTTDEGTGPGGTFTRTFTDLPPGFLYAQAKAQNQAGTGPPSPGLQFLLQDMKYLTESLFFQSGPYGSGAEGGHDVVRGFRAGTRVTIRVSTTLTPTQRQGIDSLVSQLGETGAPLTASIQTMNGNRPLCVRNEIYVVTDDTACLPAGAGCINTCGPATINTPWETALVYLNNAGPGRDVPDVVAHEMGHALLGLYHVAYLGVAERPTHPSFFGTQEFPHVLMFWQLTSGARVHDRLSDPELKAVQAAFRAGISAGSTRSDMRARGLIH